MLVTWEDKKVVGNLETFVNKCPICEKKTRTLKFNSLRPMLDTDKLPRLFIGKASPCKGLHFWKDNEYFGYRNFVLISPKMKAKWLPGHGWQKDPIAFPLYNGKVGRVLVDTHDVLWIEGDSIINPPVFKKIFPREGICAKCWNLLNKEQLPYLATDDCIYIVSQEGEVTSLSYNAKRQRWKVYPCYHYATDLHWYPAKIWKGNLPFPLNANLQETKILLVSWTWLFNWVCLDIMVEGKCLKRTFGRLPFGHILLEDENSSALNRWKTAFQSIGLKLISRCDNLEII